MTECTPNLFGFQDVGPRAVEAAFDGGRVTSDAGGLLLREIDARFGFVERFAQCFTDHRDADRTEHSLVDLLRQRLFGLCLGYEDLIDHDQLRHDPMWSVLVGKSDPLGEGRMRKADRGKALAGKSTLNRLALTAVGADANTRYKKIVAHMSRIEDYLVAMYQQQQTTPPERVVLDLDATDDPLHGDQLGGFFDGYYGHYCYLPLYIFAGDHPLCARLRPSDMDASCGALKQVQRIVAQLRQTWPNVPVLLRADGGFCREHLRRWCEANGVDYLFGLAKNSRLVRALGAELHQAKCEHQQTGQAARVFKDFTYRTHNSWSRARRVVGKAEHLAKGANPRFVVTSLTPVPFDAKALYEQEYCGRGDMENRIKEQQLCLFADRTSCATMRANQLRLYLSTVGYVMMRAMREHGLVNTEMAQARCDTIRLKLFKIGALVRVTVRRVKVSMSEGYPFRALFALVFANLKRLFAPPAQPAPV